MTKILFVTNDAWFFVSHRLPIAKTLSADGVQCIVAAKDDDSVPTIEQSGSRFTPWKISPRGKSLWTELQSFWSLMQIVKNEKPDIIHLITIKPVLYGGIVARLLGVRCCVYAISGLGAIFRSTTVRGKIIRTIISPFYKFAIGHGNGVLIFQNPDDREKLLSDFAGKTLDARIIRGSGVDTSAYQHTPEPGGVPVVVMAARILRDKGVGEFVAAAQLLKEQGVNARYVVAGDTVAEGNPGAFTESELNSLKRSDAVEFIGHSADIAGLFSQSHIVVLPSYHEGLPKVLLEAGAVGRAIVTTDVPGCRDAIVPDETGLVVPTRDHQALAIAIKTLLQDEQLRLRFGSAGRQFVEEEMNISKVVEQHRSIYNDLLKQVGLNSV